jgi:sulfur relay protein TusB/DsrH
MILHLVAKSPVDVVLFERIGEGDGVLLQSANVWLASSTHFAAKNIRQLQNRSVQIYVLSDDVQLFGLAGQSLLQDVQVITLQRLVELTIHYPVIKTWR